MDPLLTPKDLARDLGGDDGEFPVATLAQWRHRGIGPRYLIIGRHVRYRRGDVDAWIEAQYAEPRAAG